MPGAIRACGPRAPHAAHPPELTVLRVLGRFHGLLHSGGRYVVKDPQAARECIDENRILRVVGGVEHLGQQRGFFHLRGHQLLQRFPPRAPVEMQRHERHQA